MRVIPRLFAAAFLALPMSGDSSVPNVPINGASVPAVRPTTLFEFDINTGNLKFIGTEEKIQNLPPNLRQQILDKIEHFRNLLGDKENIRGLPNKEQDELIINTLRGLPLVLNDLTKNRKPNIVTIDDDTHLELVEVSGKMLSLVNSIDPRIGIPIYLDNNDLFVLSAAGKVRCRNIETGEIVEAVEIPRIRPNGSKGNIYLPANIPTVIKDRFRNKLYIVDPR